MLRRVRSGDAADDGAVLIIAMVFIIFVAVIVSASLSYAFTNERTTSTVRANRGLAYDSDAAMQKAIATIRTGECAAVDYSGHNQSAALRVDCTPETALLYQREVQLDVCYASDATCATPLLSADVTFYDDQTIGRAVIINSWSTQ